MRAGVVKPPCAFIVPPIDFQRLVVEIGVEPRQHHGAMRQLCDHMQEFCR